MWKKRNWNRMLAPGGSVRGGCFSTFGMERTNVREVPATGTYPFSLSLVFLLFFTKIEHMWSSHTICLRVIRSVTGRQFNVLDLLTWTLQRISPQDIYCCGFMHHSMGPCMYQEPFGLGCMWKVPQNQRRMLQRVTARMKAKLCTCYFALILLYNDLISFI